MTLFELLLASEYWLALHSDGSATTTWDHADACERIVLQALPGLDMKLLGPDGHQVSEGDGVQYKVSIHVYFLFLLLSNCVGFQLHESESGKWRPYFAMWSPYSEEEALELKTDVSHADLWIILHLHAR